VQQNQEVNKEGIGLGMFIVKNLVDAMGGAISLKSIKDQGTTICVTLPVKQELVRERFLDQVLTDNLA
jgi:signal transduction histidine kinase